MTVEKTEALLKLDRDNIIHPMANVGDDPSFILDEGYGVYVKDTDGKEYLDGSSRLTCVNLGFRQTEIAEAVKKQMDKLAYSDSFFFNSNPANIKCSQKLAELTQEGINHFFYTSGGSDSIDAAIRIARTYWRNNDKSGKYKVISLFNSYHGVNFGAVGATAFRQGWFSSYVNPVLNGHMHIPSYYCYRCAYNQKYPECDILCAKMLAYTIENEGAESIAAFLAEPVHGTAGSIPPPPEYWPIVRKICSEYDVLLISDEVMTGFGRTGKMFATEHWDVVPDMMTLAKGLTSAYLPLGAVATNDRVFNGLKGAPVFGFTYSGHPVCSAAAIKAMEIYIRDKVVENSAAVGDYALERLNAEIADYPHVGEISGLGLMIGIEIVANKASRESFPMDFMIKLGKQIREKGLLVRVGNRIAFTPPLIIEKEEVDKAFDILFPILSEIGE